MGCPLPANPDCHMLWCAATSELLSLAAFGPNGVAQRLTAVDSGGCVAAPKIDPPVGPDVVMGPKSDPPMELAEVMEFPKRLSRFEHAASDVVVTSGS